MGEHQMCRGILVVICICLSALASKADTPFLLGGDISMVPKLESLGAVYRDAGEPSDAISIMRKHGCNCFRIRLFVNPTMKNAVVQDLGYVVKLARRVKRSGGLVLLDLHYSDTWADPGHQHKPEAWKDLSFKRLEAKVESYTASVMATMKRAGCLPDIVQIGNEITPGFLWPDGKVSKDEKSWERFTTLLRAGIRGAKRPLAPSERVRIMLHVHAGGKERAIQWFFDRMEKHGVAYDMIGLSYYPWWQGGGENLQQALKATAETFGKEIVVVETAYPWRKTKETRSMDWPQTPGGQRQFLQDVIETVRSTPRGLGKGVIWWYPESIPTKGVNIWKGGANALFDAGGNALEALETFRGVKVGER